MADTSTLQELAAQFKKPTGTQGLAIAESMTINNHVMIEQGFANLKVQAGECLVEIGPGYALHLKEWIDQVYPIRYRGFDHSNEMVNLSNRMLQEWIPSQWKGCEAHFEHVSDQKIPLSNGIIDKLITINTLYFIADIPAWLTELYRVIRKGGQACICFALPEFMRQIPFTAYDFNLIEVDEFQEICRQSSFTEIQIIPGEDQITSPSGDFLTRKFVSFILRK